MPRLGMALITVYLDMKILIPKLFLICFYIILAGCENQNEPENEPRIEHQPINYKIVGSGIETLEFYCEDWYFELIKHDSLSTARISRELLEGGIASTCDFVSRLLVHQDGKVQALDVNTEITTHGNWIKPEAIPEGNSLEEFKGEGDKFIACKFTYYGEEFYTHLGWIRINYNSSGDGLEIIDMAICEEDERSIWAGRR